LYIKERGHCDISYCVEVWRHDGVGISESTLVPRSLVISTREFLQLWKIWPRVEDLYFCSWQGKSHITGEEERGHPKEANRTKSVHGL
jgi:hypothetical protein